MKVLLTLLLLLGVLLALSQAGALPETGAGNWTADDKPETEADPEAKHLLVKRSTCSNGWFEFKGRCFRYIPTGMSWAKAERNCVSMQANLASVHSSEEYQFIQMLIWAFTHAYGETWIGGTDAQEENIWLWSDGRTFHYTNWCRGEPDNYEGIQNCLRMNYGDGKCFDDMQCDVHHPSVCAKTV